jgi:riboflavin kinase / FMN adenylyltransferase
MQVLKGTQAIPPALQGAFITIGNFDGVHRGHRHIFQTMLEEASREDRKTLLVTFTPHPKMVLHPERRPFYLLTTLEEKLHLLEDIGLDAVILIPFTTAYAETSAESFIVDFLWNKLHAKKIFIGHDYTFGYKKGGNKEVLAAYGKKLGFEVKVITAFSADGSVISSTNIRKAILEGNVKRAAFLLGRPYNVSGTVVAGKGRGRTLGFPTANVRPTKELLPAQGIYAAFINVEGGTCQGVLNIGSNPTFGYNAISLEVHIMDFTGNLYGKSLEVLFIDRLREERKFPGPEELVVQMKKDVEQARSILSSPTQ